MSIEDEPEQGDDYLLFYYEGGTEMELVHRGTEVGCLVHAMVRFHRHFADGAVQLAQDLADTKKRRHEMTVGVLVLTPYQGL